MPLVQPAGATSDVTNLTNNNINNIINNINLINNNNGNTPQKNTYDNNTVVINISKSCPE